MRLQLFENAIFSVDRSANLYMHPSSGEPLKLSPEIFSSEELQPEGLAAFLAHEYGDKSLSNAFETAIVEFMNSRSDHRLMFYRNGRTEVK